MAYQYLEPTQAPRGPEVTSLEARKRIISNARLARYFVPEFDQGNQGHRQIIKQSKRKPLGPYTSPVDEGLINLVKESEKKINGGVA